MVTIGEDELEPSVWGKNDPLIRQSICNRLSVLGITPNHNRNQGRTKGPFYISDETSKVNVLVVPANEELEIAGQAVTTINRGSAN